MLEFHQIVVIQRRHHHPHNCHDHSLTPISNFDPHNWAQFSHTHFIVAAPIVIIIIIIIIVFIVIVIIVIIALIDIIITIITTWTVIAIPAIFFRPIDFSNCNIPPPCFELKFRRTQGMVCASQDFASHPHYHSEITSAAAR